MLQEFHPEIQTYVKSKCLIPGDTVIFDGDKYRFVCLSTIRHGRLGAPGVEPGIYIDRTRAIIAQEEDSKTVAIEELEIDDALLETRIKKLPTDFHLISLAPDKLGDLPELDIYEGDIVSLVDESHEFYSTNPNENQYTVNRIIWEKNPIQFKLRRGSAVFRVTQEQIKFWAAGPVKLFYGGEGYKLKLGDSTGETSKATAEFYLLLGRYLRVYNPLNKSYYWDLPQAQQMIELGKAHAILKQSDGLALVKFWDSEIGEQISYFSDLILEI